MAVTIDGGDLRLRQISMTEAMNTRDKIAST